MKPFTVIAHRGLAENAPGNTMEAFRAARAAGADGVELDVRLTRDGVPIVHHNWYLNEDEPEPTPIHLLTVDALRHEPVRDKRPEWSLRHTIPPLSEVLEEFAGELKLEIELKGPEPELVDAVLTQLERSPQALPSVEITSDMTSALARVRELMPHLDTALLMARTPPYMRADVVGHVVVHLARQAGVRIVHLQRTQLSEGVIDQLRAAGLTPHVYPVNDAADMNLAMQFAVPEVVTDDLRRLLALRDARAETRK